MKSPKSKSTHFAADLSRRFQTALGAEPDDAARAFIAGAAEDALPGELPDLDAEGLAETLADFWRWAERRTGGKALVRLEPVAAAGEGARLDRLEIVQADAPFLVDSVMAAVAQLGFTVRAMVHPVVPVARDGRGRRTADGGKAVRESMIQVILDRVGADREATLLQAVQETLADVHAAVDDFEAMRALLGAVIAEFELRAPPSPSRREELAFLNWLQGEHFVFLGAREYDFPRLPDGGYAAEEPAFDGGLGVLRDPDQAVLRRSSEPAVLSSRLERRLREPAVTVAKANLRSRVHRRGYMDYVAVKRFGEDGRPVGEARFAGLFTAEAYDEPANAVPLIRAKVAAVVERAGAQPGSHNDKRLRNLIENHPRDELFQASEDDLLRIAQAVLHVQDRPRVSLIERRDGFDRFASVLLFLPRDRLSSDVTDRVGAILARAYGGRVSAAYPSFSEAPLARVHYIIGFTPGDHLEPDMGAVEAEVAAAVRTWEDRFEAAVRAEDLTPDAASARLDAARGAFPPGYRDRYGPDEGLIDLAVIQALGPEEPLRVRAFRNAGDGADVLRIKLYRSGEPAVLADVLPILDHMGLKAMFEAGFPLAVAGRSAVWVHEFELRRLGGRAIDFDDAKDDFEEAFVAVWTGQTENDGFNGLVLALSIPWRDAALVRALARCRQQSGVDPGEAVQAQALADHPGVTRLILDLFRVRFDPAVRAGLEARRKQSDAVMEEIVEALQEVPSQDDDRVLRRIAQLVQAIQRTSFYQLDAAGRPKPSIAFKIASGQLVDLPSPKPYREIFVWAVDVEAVHLRFGPVARGGLRWSDRRDDFRTEVLGLAKAQQVKNAVIVPVGAKGGFYAKLAPKGGDPDAVRKAGQAAYRTFLNGALDITDNLDPDGKTIPPEGVVVHDPDDAYLVVAADKGTATFSDLANSIAAEHDFWLDDAFASGGSAGYDHKAMGITARGAWEAVKRHFRELGRDIQAEPFSCVGVGDMSGDVFGNGMLLLEQTRLTAAFDHRHIFLDPSPDAAASFAERKRLFALPRSSWDDYDRSRISAGGGIFPRSQKSIPLTAEVRALLGVEADTATPQELMRAILRAETDLLYLGGIGTYVKARGEANAEVGDKANDAIRVDGATLRCKVVGEGANLGFTQAGRIEYALAGGRIDTDAIDNSAGVDTSDHEVNIKILTGALERSGGLTRKARDTLLAKMTDDVADHVLAHNYDQTLALSLLQVDAAGELDAYARYMSELEGKGRLDRALEGLPDAVALIDRQRANQGLTRPELAVILAYGKLELSQALAQADLTEPHFEGVLEAYFPKALHRYAEALRRHPLRREIVATVIANDVVNRCGPTFASRLTAAASAQPVDLARAYEAAKAAFGVDALWDEVSSLDGKVPAKAQIDLYRELGGALRALTYWFARRSAREGLGVEALRDRYAAGLKALTAISGDILSTGARGFVERRVARHVEAGAPEALARRAATLLPLSIAVDLIDLAAASSWPLEAVARVHRAAGEALGFDLARSAAGAHRAGDHFERTAVRRLLEALLAEQVQAVKAVIDLAGRPDAGASPEAAAKAVEAFAASRAEAVDQARRTIAEIEAEPGGWSFAKLTIAEAALRGLASASAGTPASR